MVIRTVEEGGSAQAVGLQPGDVIAELDGEDVQQWSLEQVNPSFSASVLDHWCVCARLQVMSRARSSAKVPPSLVVISRVRQFRLRRDRAGGYGLTVRGDGPVFVRSVDVPSPAREAGLRSGDLLLEVDSHSVRQASKLEVLELLRASGDVLALTVITGGLDWSIAAPPPHLSSPSTTSLLSQSRLMRNNTRYQKAATFHNKVNSKNWFTAMGFCRYESERPLIPLQLHYLVMHNSIMRDFAEIMIFMLQVNYYLMGEVEKKAHLMTLLRLYAGSRDVDSLVGSLDILLEGPIQRRLIPAVRWVYYASGLYVSHDDDDDEPISAGISSNHDTRQDLTLWSLPP